MSKWTAEWENRSMEEKLEHALEKLNYHTQRYIDKPGSGRLYKVRKWAGMAAHAIFEVRPDLREENSLLRYFVAKAGRAKGIYGKELTGFIDNEYQKGTWYTHIPEEILKASM